MTREQGMASSIAGARKDSKRREIHDWEVDDALSTLTRAEKIKKDKPLMERVKKRAAERLQEVAAVAAELGNAA